MPRSRSRSRPSRSSSTTTLRASGVQLAYWGFFSVFSVPLAFVSILGFAFHNDPSFQTDVLDSTLRLMRDRSADQRSHRVAHGQHPGPCRRAGSCSVDWTRRHPGDWQRARSPVGGPTSGSTRVRQIQDAGTARPRLARNHHGRRDRDGRARDRGPDDTGDPKSAGHHSDVRRRPCRVPRFIRAAHGGFGDSPSGPARSCTRRRLVCRSRRRCRRRRRRREGRCNRCPAPQRLSSSIPGDDKRAAHGLPSELGRRASHLNSAVARPQALAGGLWLEFERAQRRT